ncbi:type IV pilus biogenesis/stability protein PilW [Dyella sp.]|jgi:type IV pilus assembly protein PilF|uniref:type IV pilus biogenesis/stability protein PilW n=1 Tax=Dyella sp. TaxID=1869338 RepID=UPI002D768B85|nr:type IV pilus biogenesis/stability protein PilW [Dyella sp.]HET6432859.1 type IV pilus biogenesis/stability protein PilW [Dyella sp.]
MRVDRWWGSALCALLAGCVSVGGANSGSQDSSGDRLPRTSRADKAEEAARIHTELGQHYMQGGDLQTALEKLTKALQFDEGYAPAHTVIAVVYERINDMPKAELHYRRAVELEPTKGGPNNNLGAFLCRVGKGAESEAYFRKAVADPFYSTPDVALTNAGVCQLKNGDAAAAQNEFREALQRNPNNGEALLQLANTMYQSGDAFRARAFLQRFDALRSPSADALQLGYLIESRLGNTDAALSYRQRLLSQFPDSAQARNLDQTTRP